jgi:hypothetical protein
MSKTSSYSHRATQDNSSGMKDDIFFIRVRAARYTGEQHPPPSWAKAERKRQSNEKAPSRSRQRRPKLALVLV